MKPTIYRRRSMPKYIVEREIPNAALVAL